MRKYRIITMLLCFSLVMGLLTGCSSHKKKEKAEKSTSALKNSGEFDDITLEGMVSDVLSGMTLKEKIGQMFIVCTDSLDFDAETEVTETMEQKLKEYKPGGVIFFSYNIKTREQVKNMIAEIEKTTELPLFISVDEEGGSVARIANSKNMHTTKFPAMAEIGKSGDSKNAYNVGETIGKEIHELGFNLDFAPVADINTNSENTEIGNRSFSSEPKTVADMVAQEVKGLQSQGVSATLKHFPGQGQCGEDTHKGYVELDATIDRLREVEFLPFKAGIAADSDMVMMSHVAVSQITGKETPASLTKLMVNDILREELQFNNVIITDAMNMKVITKFYDADQAAVMAVEAGNDMILMPDNFELAFEGLLEAVKDGTISENQIDEAVGRILTVKIRRGIIPKDSKLFRQNAGK